MGRWSSLSSVGVAWVPSNKDYSQISVAQGYQAGSLFWAVSFSRLLVPTSEHLGDGTETMCHHDESTESRAGSVEVRTHTSKALRLVSCSAAAILKFLIIL